MFLYFTGIEFSIITWYFALTAYLAIIAKFTFFQLMIRGVYMNTIFKNLSFKFDKKTENIIIYIIIGIILIIAGSFFFKGGGQKNVAGQKSSSDAANNSYEACLESKLKDILSKMKGVKNVDVMITLSSDKNTINPAYDTTQTTKTTQETDTQGGKRSETEVDSSNKVVLTNDSNGNSPVVTSESKPAINGVLVIVGGTNDDDLLYNVSNAVQVALGIPAYKVMVVAGNK